MPVIDTATLQQGEIHPANDQLYNGLDVCLTLEIFEELSSLRNQPPEIYNFERALQAPALAMMRRGFRIDEYERKKGLEQLRKQLTIIDNCLQRFAYAVWDKTLNPNSHKQLKAFFYSVMKLPEQWSSKKGVKKISFDRESLEKLEIYLYARPIICCILAIRDIEKQIQDFEQSIENGRYYTSFNIAGTETWRFSSSKSSRGTGGNIQNKKRDDDIGEGELSLRKPFIADEGHKLCEIDLEQAESREVGWLCWVLFADPTYLDACESGDLHTDVARMCWPNLAWNGDAKHDRKLADTLFYRNYSYRDMSKKLGHGSNYFGQPFTMARQAKIPQKMAQAFQDKYFSAFPGIAKWHRYVAQQLQTVQRIENSFGVSRTFFGRPNDDTTLREAIAHGPQSSTAMRTNLAMWRIWRYMSKCELLAQKHDSITFQFPIAGSCAPEVNVVNHARAYFSTELTHRGRIFDVGTDVKVGWNWGKYDAVLNPNGMRKYKGTDTRVRLQGLDRVL